MTNNKSNLLQTVFILMDKTIVSKNPNDLKSHPLNIKLFGDLLDDEYERLKKDIKQRGIQDPLHITKDDVIVSGHQRNKIASELGINVPCIVRNDLDVDWKIEEQLIFDNLLRRHLSDFQKAECGKRLEVVESEKAKQRQAENAKRNQPQSQKVENLPPLENKGKSRDKVAEKIGMSGRQYDKARKIYNEAPEEILNDWKEEKISTHAAYQIITNKDKGMGDHSRKIIFSSKSDDWKTPNELYKKLNNEFHFDFDPCPLKATFDGLKINWKKTNFVNPPYSNIDGFLEKAHNEFEENNSITHVFLIPVRTDTKWFHTYIYPYFKKQTNGIKADIRFLKGRVKFENGSKTKHSAPFPSMVVILRRIV